MRFEGICSRIRVGRDGVRVSGLGLILSSSERIFYADAHGLRIEIYHYILFQLFQFPLVGEYSPLLSKSLFARGC